MTEDETVGWHHRLDGHEFEQVLGFGDGHPVMLSGLACCSPWDSPGKNTGVGCHWADGKSKLKGRDTNFYQASSRGALKVNVWRLRQAL